MLYKFGQIYFFLKHIKPTKFSNTRTARIAICSQDRGRELIQLSTFSDKYFTICGRKIACVMKKKEHLLFLEAFSLLP